MPREMPVGMAGSLVSACRCPRWPVNGVRTRGLWTITQQSLGIRSALKADIPVGSTLTSLFRMTEATMQNGLGECVMEDSLPELRRHLPILMAAHGRVLVSGLGLGCVVRGLLAKPTVTHIDVIEISGEVLGLVGGEFVNERRVRFHHGNALTLQWQAGSSWDFAWHDIWSEDKALDLLHAELIATYMDRVRYGQGAWGWRRDSKKLMARNYPKLLS